MPTAIIRGVQKHKNRVIIIKHFECNNQEMDRFNSNSLVCVFVSWLNSLIQ